MIETFEGRIGGGKTYSAMERMFAHWLRGGLVATNVEVKWPEAQAHVLKKWRVKLDPAQFRKLENEEICRFPALTPVGTMDLPVLVIIDEAHLWLESSAERRNKEKMALLAFLTQSRKQHTDVIFITQSVKNLDCKVARLNQFVWRFRDMQKVKIPGTGMYYPLPQIKQFQFDYDGKTLEDRRFVWREKEVFETYDSHALHSPIDRLEGALTKFAVTKVKREELPAWMVYGSAALAILAVAML